MTWSCADQMSADLLGGGKWSGRTDQLGGSKWLGRADQLGGQQQMDQLGMEHWMEAVMLIHMWRSSWALELISWETKH